MQCPENRLLFTKRLNAQFVVVRQLSHRDSQQLTMLVNNNKLITVILKIIQLSVYKYCTLNDVKNGVISDIRPNNRACRLFKVSVLCLQRWCVLLASKFAANFCDLTFTIFWRHIIGPGAR